MSLDKYKRICEQCDKEFYLNPRLGLKWVKKTGRGRFCTDKCSRLARRGLRVSKSTEFKEGEYKWGEHPNFKTGIWSYRKFKKDKCEDCNSVKILHVHHIDRDRHNNKPSNLRTVCKDCHWSYHRGNRKAWNKGLKMGKVIKNVT